MALSRMACVSWLVATLTASCAAVSSTSSFVLTAGERAWAASGAGPLRLERAIAGSKGLRPCSEGRTGTAAVEASASRRTSARSSSIMPCEHLPLR